MHITGGLPEIACMTRYIFAWQSLANILFPFYEMCTPNNLYKGENTHCVSGLHSLVLDLGKTGLTRKSVLEFFLTIFSALAFFFFWLLWKQPFLIQNTIWWYHFLLRFTFSCCLCHSVLVTVPPLIPAPALPWSLHFFITTELKLTFHPNHLFFTVVVQQDKQSSQALWCSQPQGLFCSSPLLDSEGVAQWKTGILGFGPSDHQDPASASSSICKTSR